MAKRHLLIGKNRVNFKLYVTLFLLLVGLVLVVKLASIISQSKIENVSFVAVPAPKTFIPAGSELSPDKFEIVKVPGNLVNENIVTDMKTFNNVQAKFDLMAGQPVKYSSLIPVVKTYSALQERIPEGMRAMTLSVDQTTSVEGWALPGSLVDVLLVKKDGKTQLVAEKVKILSLGGQLEGDPSSPGKAKTITILVSQEQALAIASAQPLGKLAFTLRGLDDEQNWQVTHFDPANIGVKPAPTARVEGMLKYKDESGRDVHYTILEGKLIPVEEKR